MSSYLGYRLIVNGTTIPDGMVKRGSFKATPKKRLVYSWKNANRKDREDILEERQMDISIAIRMRTLAEHDTIKGVFSLEENVPVTYWDDKTCTYKTGTFRMDAPSFEHSNTKGGDILYAPTTIHLLEY